MDNNNLLQVFQALKNGTEETMSARELADHICSIHGYNTPFELQFKWFDDPSTRDYDIILIPGSPVQIVLNDRWVIECITARRSPSYFRSRLAQALDRMFRVHRTLQHPVPLSVAIALRKEAKTWFKIPAPMFEQKLLHSKYLEIKYSITVTDNITKTSINLNGTDPNELKREATKRLSNIIYDNEELLAMFEELEDLASFKKEHNPSKVKLGGMDNEIRDAREY